MTVRRLSDQEIADLLEPWLGEGNITGDLPVPAMMDVQIDSRLALNLKALSSRLHQLSDKIHIDDHQKWLGHFVRLTRMVEYCGARDFSAGDPGDCGHCNFRHQGRLGGT